MRTQGSILFVHTVTPRRFFVALVQENGRSTKRAELRADYPKPERFFPLVRRVIGKTTLAGILVVTGPGGFSATRAGVMIGNTLSFALQIPLVGVRMKEKETDRMLLQRGIRLLHSGKISKLLEPYYGQEPNITVRS